MIPKYKPIQSSTIVSPKVFNRTYFQGLESEVQASRVAVENITRLASVEQKFKNKIEDVQQELQNCVGNISTETKKQRILAELIYLLKGEINMYQTTKKKVEEADEAQREKLKKKMQYEIDQLLQKHNEEIAKIHQLKDVADSKRSERVVYSNLFKKLEKEIKYFEQLYKESIMHTEATRNKQLSLGKFSERQNNLNSIKQDLLADKKSLKRISTVKKFINLEYDDVNMGKEENHIFLTSQKSSEGKKFLALQESLEGSRSSLRNTFNREERKAHAKQTMQEITHLTNLIDDIKINSQCSDVGEVLSRYTHLEQDNENLEKEIAEYDEIIEQWSAQTRELHRKMKEIQFEKKYTMIVSNPASDNEEEEDPIQDETSNMMQIVRSLASMFGCQTQIDQKIKIQESQLNDIETKITELVSKEKTEKSTMKSRKQTSGSENAVEGMLQKMQKFGNCERILDRNLFQQEYYKELSKRRLKASRR